MAVTGTNTVDSIGNEREDTKGVFIYNIGSNWECGFDPCLTGSVSRFCKASMLRSFPRKYFATADCTLMEDPEERLDEDILNGVALRPRVNSETDTSEGQNEHGIQEHCKAMG